MRNLLLVLAPALAAIVLALGIVSLVWEPNILVNTFGCYAVCIGGPSTPVLLCNAACEW